MSGLSPRLHPHFICRQTGGMTNFVNSLFCNRKWLSHIGVFGFGMTAFLGAAPAMAQYSPSATMDLGIGYGQIAINQSIFSSTSETSNKKSAPKTAAKKTTPHNAVSLNPLSFRWDETISGQYRRDLVKRASSKRPDLRAEVAHRLNSLDPAKTFRQLSYQYGLKPFSISDLTATYCVASWEMINERKANRQKIQEIKNAIRRDIESSPMAMQVLRDVSQQKKQFWIEEQAYEIVLNRAAYSELKRKGDSGELKRFRAQAIVNAEKRGVLLKDLVL